MPSGREMLRVTSSAFETAFRRTLAKEGGLANNKADNGGQTQYGISLRFLRSVQPEATEDTIRNLTLDTVKELYWKYFWLPAYDTMPLEVAVRVFDMAVVSGPVQAAKCIQRALLACGHAIADDGILGNKTMAAVRTTKPDILIPALRSEMAAHFRCIVARDPSQKVFLAGWLTNRAYCQD